MRKAADVWEPLRQVLIALADAQPDITVVGGWAFRLYALHPDAGPAEIDSIATLDADLVLAPVIDLDLGAALEHASFKKISGGTTTPRIEKFRATIGGDEIEVEFLCHRPGAEVKRTGPDRLTTIGNVTVQRLPHLDLLVAHAIEVEIPDGSGGPRVRARIPHPAAYLIHKLMVLRARAAEKRPKDVRYVHDVLMRFADRLDAWRAGLEGLVPAPRRAKGGVAFIDWDLIVEASTIGRARSR